MINTLEPVLYGADPHITIDSRDEQILADRFAEWQNTAGPRVGDFVLINGTTLHRFSHDWGESMQHSRSGSYYFSAGGHCSFSGGLYPGIDKARLTLTPDIKLGDVWFFHHGYAQAHSAVFARIPCRVYTCTGPVEVW